MMRNLETSSHKMLFCLFAIIQNIKEPRGNLLKKNPQRGKLTFNLPGNLFLKNLRLCQTKTEKLQFRLKSLSSNVHTELYSKNETQINDFDMDSIFSLYIYLHFKNAYTIAWIRSKRNNFKVCGQKIAYMIFVSGCPN